MTPRTPDRTQKIREERQAQILAAALELFAEKGLHNTRVSEIAARAGVSQGTIYWYFDSKEALFETAFMSQLDAMFEPIVRLMKENLSAEAKLLRAVEASLDLMTTDIEFFYLLMQAISTREVANLLAYDFQELYTGLKEMTASLFQELGDPDPEATASVLLAILDGLGFQYMISPRLFDRDRVLAQIKEKFDLQEG